MPIKQELLDEQLKDYQKPEDLLVNLQNKMVLTCFWGSRVDEL